MAAGCGRRVAGGDVPARRCNLERFLEATTPVVTPSSCSSSKEGMNGWDQSDADDSLPFFTLGDLWDAFRECSAYGTAVPLVLNGCSDGVVQYYVPYLSAIQLYGGFRNHIGPSRTGAEESDSDMEHETSSSANAFSTQETSESSSASEASSSDEGESGSCHEQQLLFEFLESESPYQRQPLADKACLTYTHTHHLAKRFPELMTLRSCDLSPASWISIAWYPIYRIPTGPTTRDLDACFLTYHSLSTQFVGGSSHGPKPRAATKCSTPVTAMWLPTFALASYKLKGAAWTPGWRDRQLAASLAQAADAWLRLQRADHPDHRFFAARRAPSRRW
ncbi:hypothetical protein HU200_031316 [Digitaria exilis]|uniref:Uncharacterized protein n=1 Tax=Digitaria exilis TaxID=1010633 RepID=A0A835BMR5_9POAL|nr:hypothetical protein HU200_031316 [Digitaria exilis]CAB3476349.1 unnamed protein product [Digitaria exilis]